MSEQSNKHFITEQTKNKIGTFFFFKALPLFMTIAALAMLWLTISLKISPLWAFMNGMVGFACIVFSAILYALGTIK